MHTAIRVADQGFLEPQEKGENSNSKTKKSYSLSMSLCCMMLSASHPVLTVAAYIYTTYRPLEEAEMWPSCFRVALPGSKFPNYQQYDLGSCRSALCLSFLSIEWG